MKKKDEILFFVSMMLFFGILIFLFSGCFTIVRAYPHEPPPTLPGVEVKISTGFGWGYQYHDFAPGDVVQNGEWIFGRIASNTWILIDAPKVQNSTPTAPVKYLLTWEVSRTVPDACPGFGEPDEYTGEIPRVACAVYHFKIIRETRRKEFDDWDEMQRFIKGAPPECSGFKIEEIEK